MAKIAQARKGVGQIDALKAEIVRLKAEVTRLRKQLKDTATEQN